MATASTDLLLGLAQLLVVLAVAEHAEVARHAAVGVDRDARQDLLALLEAEPLHVEVREADPVAVCVGFSRSCAATACAKRSRFLAILPVSAISRKGTRLPTR